MPAVFLAAAGAYAATQLSQRWLSGMQSITLTDSAAHMVTSVAVTLLYEAVHCVILAAISVPIYRLMLLEERTVVAADLAPNVLRLAAWMLLFRMPAIVFSLGFFTRFLLRHSGIGIAQVAGVFTLFNAVTQLIVYFVWVRCSPLFPAVAVDASGAGALARLRQAWRLSRPRQWRIFWAVAIAYLPLFLVAGLLGILILLNQDAFVAGRGGVPSDGISWGELILRDVAAITGSAVIAATLAWIYLPLTKAFPERTAAHFT
jgi:hypothetical protein